MDEIVNEFLVESNENLDRLDQELVSLEKEPEKAETLASVFRTIHTIKGTCGFLGFTQLESVACGREPAEQTPGSRTEADTADCYRFAADGGRYSRNVEIDRRERERGQKR